MLIGIDVGGTFTDGVIFKGSRILSWAKEPTDDEHLESSLLQVLDKLLDKADVKEIKRIVLSTTLVTNLIVTDSGPQTALILMPGYSLPYNSYKIAPDTYFAQGSIDFRGNEIEAVNLKEIEDTIVKIKHSNIKKVAVAGKFSNRNQKHELMIKDLFAQKYPAAVVTVSSQITQQLNFPRRAFTCYLTARTMDKWNSFIDNMQLAMTKRNIKAPVHILKADGGTLPMDIARSRPCETIFSGPAASTMGGLALTKNEAKNSVVLDIGGTTTDISLLIAGQPLYASQGARIDEKYTHIKSFAVKSIPLGGDSILGVEEDHLKIGPGRKGPAACFGGEAAAVTDAFNCAFELKIGSLEDSRQKLEVVASSLNMTTVDFSRMVVDETLQRIKTAVFSMFKEWEQEPAYKVWEIVNRKPFHLDRIIGIGAASEAIIPILAANMNIEYYLHNYSPIANALGSAVARPTLTVNLHADTQADLYTVEPGGIQKNLGKNKNLQINDVRQLARQYLENIAAERGMDSYAHDAEFFLEEQFNVIRGWDRLGKLFEIGIQITPGFIDEFRGVSE